jgi:SAM-dependent methyltransferase
MSIKFGTSFRALLGHPYALSRVELQRQLTHAIGNHIYDSVLDIGCGSMPYRSLFSTASLYQGLEISRVYGAHLPTNIFFYDGLNIPFANNSYDAVLCSQVLEHASEPGILLKEILRILKPQGVLFMTIPFFWPEHELPYDYRRFTRYGLQKLLETAGFESVNIKSVDCGLSTLLQLLIEYSESKRRKYLSWLPNYAWRALTLIPYSFFNILGFTLNRISSKLAPSYQPSFYLNLVASAIKP